MRSPYGRYDRDSCDTSELFRELETDQSIEVIRNRDKCILCVQVDNLQFVVH